MISTPEVPLLPPGDSLPQADIQEIPTGIEKPMEGTQVYTPQILPADMRPYIQKAKSDISGTRGVYESLGGGRLVPQDTKPIKSVVGFRSIYESHTRLSDGRFVPKFEEFIWGTDNEERLAQNQSTSDKWVNGLTKASATVGETLAKGTVGSVYGLISAIGTGSMEAFYNNDFSNTLSDWNATVAAYNPNYYTEVENNRSLFGQMATANFWADKVVGGAAFTVGTLASEAIWAVATGGVGLGASAAARMGAQAAVRSAVKAGTITRAQAQTAIKLAKETGKAQAAVNKALSGSKLGPEVVEQIGLNASRYAKVSRAAGSARFMLTSSAIEAGMEASTFKNTATEDFFSYYRDIEGRTPTQEELTAFNQELDGKANNVFGWNMAILAPSNMAMFGKMFKAYNSMSTAFKGANAAIDKRFFRLGTKKMADGTYKALEAGTKHKILKIGTNLSSAAAIEGIWEEGGQGIASGTYANFIQSTYDQERFGHIETLGDSFNHTFGEQYTTKDGLTEVLIGGIIGLAFGGARTVGGTLRDYKKQTKVAEFQNEVTEMAKENLTSMYVGRDLASKIGRANRDQYIGEKMESAIDEQDALKLEIAKAEQLVSKMAQAKALDKEDFFEETLIGSLREMDVQHASEMLGITVEEAAAYKEATIKSVKDTVDSYKRNYNFAESVFGARRIGGVVKDDKGNEINTHNLVEATAYALTMGKVADTVIRDGLGILNEMSARKYASEELATGVSQIVALGRASKELSQEHETLSAQKKTLMEEIAVLKDRITRAQLEDADKGRAEKYQALAIELNEKTQQAETLEARLNIVKEQILIDADGEVTGIADLNDDTIQDRLKKIHTSLRTLPEDKRIEAEKLLNTIFRATEHSKSFQFMAGNLINPEFRFKTYNSIFGKVAASTTSVNDHTRETILKWLSTPRPTGKIERDTERLEGLTEAEAIIRTRLEQGPVTLEELKEEMQNIVDRLDDSEPRKRLYEEIIELLENEPGILERLKGYRGEKSEARILQEEAENALPVEDSLTEEEAQAVEATDETIEKLVDKVLRGEELSTREQAIVDNNKETYDILMEIKMEEEMIQRGLEEEAEQKRKDELRARDEALVEAKIKKVQEELNKIQNEQADLSDLKKFLDDFLADAVAGYNVSMNEAIKQIKVLKSIVASKTTQKTKRGKATLAAVEKLRNDIRFETAFGQELLNRLSENAKKQQQLEQIAADLQAQIDYYNSIKGTTATEVDSKISALKARRSVVTKLRDQYKKLIKSLQKTLGRLVDVTIGSIKAFEAVSDFKYKTTEEIAQGIKEGNDIDGYADAKRQYEQLAQEVEDSMAVVEGAENKIAGAQQDLASAEKQLTAIDQEIRFLEELQDEFVIREIMDEEMAALEAEAEARRQKAEEEYADKATDNRTTKEKLEDNRRAVRDRVREVYENNIVLHGDEAITEENLINLEVPTQEEVDEYAELYNTEDKTEEQEKREEELREKLFRYGLARDLDYQGTNLLELIQLGASLNKQAEAQEQKLDVTEEDIGKIIDIGNSGVGNYSNKVTKVNEGTMVTKGGTTTHMVTMPHMMDLVEKKYGFRPRIAVAVLDKDGNLQSEEILDSVEEIESLEGKDYAFDIIDQDGDTIVGGVMEKGKMKGLSRPIGEVTDVIAKKFQGQTHEYVLLFEKNSDGTYSPMQTYLNEKKSTGEIVINGVKEGDNVTLVHNVMDPINQKILEELGLGRKKSDRSTRDYEIRISKEKAYDEYVKKAYVEVRYKNANVGYIAADYSLDKKGNTFQNTRNAAIREGQVRLPVENVYRNYPNVQLDSEQNLIMHELDKNHKNFRGIGTVTKTDNGEIVFQDNLGLEVNHKFTRQFLGKLKGGAYAVVEIGPNNYYSIPVTVDPVMKDMTEFVSGIIDNPNYSDEFKSTKINDYININNLDHELVTPETLYEADRNVLNNIPQYPNMKDTKAIQNADYKIPVPMDKALFLPKFRLNFDEAIYKKSKKAVNQFKKTQRKKEKECKV